MDVKETVATELEGARHRSLDLLAPVREEAQVRQHSTLMSPLIWDLAHIGVFEELWLLRRVAGAAPLLPSRYDEIYNAAMCPRCDRGTLPLLGPAESRMFIGEVRGRVLDVLERIDLSGDDALLADAFVYWMIVQHEHQHDETMLSTLQLMPDDEGPYPVADAAAAATALTLPAEVLVPGGTFTMGVDAAPWAYDNERPAHPVTVAPFFIDTTPVTNAAYLEFITAGGYDDPRWWTPAGWAWRQQAGLAHPQFWERGTDGWGVRRYGRALPLTPSEPVQHVCWYEADAYARWAGKRLPTEAEWEAAAVMEPVTVPGMTSGTTTPGMTSGMTSGTTPGDRPGRSPDSNPGKNLDSNPGRNPDSRTDRMTAAGGHLASGSGGKPKYPWGDTEPTAARANLGQRRFGPAPVGSFPDGASPCGVHQLIGDVWEWTSSDFTGYPGFTAFPYPEYSEVFFGTEYKVLRGGSWATSPHVARTTFRNWDYPIRRQIFTGFRCARDA